MLRSWIAPVVVVSALVAASCGSDTDQPVAAPVPTTTAIPTTEAVVALPTAYDAWVRMPAMGQTVAAAYVTFVNGADVDVALLGVSSPGVEAGLHETVADDDGVMRMQPRPQGFVVPAGGELVMAPGGVHIMLLGIDVLALATAQELPLMFDFGASGSVTVMAEVRGELAGGSGTDDTDHDTDHDHDHDHDHDRDSDHDTDHEHGDRHQDGHAHDDALPFDPSELVPGELDAHALHDLDDELHAGVLDPDRQRLVVAQFRVSLLATEVPSGFDLDGLLAALDELDAALVAGDRELAAGLAFLVHDLAHALLPHQH